MLLLPLVDNIPNYRNFILTLLALVAATMENQENELTNKPDIPRLPRWHYRFLNYSRAFVLLRQAVERVGDGQDGSSDASADAQLPSSIASQLEREGTITRFTYTWELAWKVLKDYLEAQGIVLPTITPTAVIKSAFAAGIIADAEVWLRALDARNKMAHTYNFDTFQAVLISLNREYLAALDTLHTEMMERYLEENQGPTSPTK